MDRRQRVRSLCQLQAGYPGTATAARFARKFSSRHDLQLRSTAGPPCSDVDFSQQRFEKSTLRVGDSKSVSLPVSHRFPWCRCVLVVQRESTTKTQRHQENRASVSADWGDGEEKRGAITDKLGTAAKAFFRFLDFLSFDAPAAFYNLRFIARENARTNSRFWSLSQWFAK